jgi:hypothetical protein
MMVEASRIATPIASRLAATTKSVLLLPVLGSMDTPVATFNAPAPFPYILPPLIYREHESKKGTLAGKADIPSRDSISPGLNYT